MEFAHLEEVRIINERLEKIYGRHVAINKPIFRLVFGPDQIEKRLSTKSFYIGEIFLREQTGIFELPKYDYLTESGRVWIVERLISNQHPDVYDGNYTYEPVYAFKIFPIWRAVEFMLFNLFNPKGPKSQKEAEYRDNEKKEKEKAEIKNMLDTTPLETSLHDGSAKSFSNTEGIDYRPSQQKG